MIEKGKWSKGSRLYRKIKSQEGVISEREFLLLQCIFMVMGALEGDNFVVSMKR